MTRALAQDPESRYATDALGKIDVCRGRLAQKEVWIAAYYYYNQGNAVGARQRLEKVLREYGRTLVVPEAMFLLAEISSKEGKANEALVRLLSDYFGIPKSKILIIKGTTSKYKLVEIEGRAVST